MTGRVQGHCVHGPCLFAVRRCSDAGKLPANRGKKRPSWPVQPKGGFRAIMFADDCRYGCREATTTGQKHEIESILITNARRPVKGTPPLGGASVLGWRNRRQTVRRVESKRPDDRSSRIVRAIRFAVACRYGCWRRPPRHRARDKNPAQINLVCSHQGTTFVRGYRGAWTPHPLKNKSARGAWLWRDARWPEPKPQSSSGNYVRGGICSRCRFV
jgi:hypothetical protein